MRIEVDVEKRLGGFALKAAFSSDTAVTALFGRSGTGKTTLVNIIAGLIRPERGRIVLDGETLLDCERGIDVPTHRRRVGYVFQEGRLLPNLTVRQNLLYGRYFAKAHGTYVKLDHLVDLLGLAGLLQRRPAALSGGEKQRVAIGRALANEPPLTAAPFSVTLAAPSTLRWPSALATSTWILSVPPATSMVPEFVMLL